MPLRHLSVPGQLLAWCMILFPVSGVVLAQMIPGAEGAFQRVRVLGLVADTIVIPLLGLFLATFLAELFQQGVLRRFYAVLNLLLGSALLVAVPVFVLDVLQVRAGVQDEMRRLYYLNSVRSLLLLSLAGITLVLLGVLVWRAARRARTVPEPATSGLVRPAPTR